MNGWDGTTNYGYDARDGWSNASRLLERCSTPTMPPAINFQYSRVTRRREHGIFLRSTQSSGHRHGRDRDFKVHL